jgi:hypothetical protein
VSEPSSFDEPTVRFEDGEQPEAPTGPPPAAGAEREPGLGRRVALLAATLYLPAILLGYALYQYGPATSCVAGPFCAFGDAPILLQVTLCAVGFGLLYLISARPLAAALDPRWPARSEVARMLRRAARYETIRPLLAVLGALVALTLLVGMIARALPWPAGIIGLGVAALLLWLAASSEP